MSKPDISVCMMVKNSDDTLPIALKYIEENFSEFCVLIDPESSDRSETQILEFATGFPTTIEYGVTTNFASRLDKVFSMAKTRYYVHMDADEIFEDFDWLLVEKIMDRSRSDIGVVEEYHLQKDLFNYRQIDQKLRIMRTSSNVRNDGRVMHGSLNYQGKKICPLPVRLIHFGHLRSLQQLQKKARDTIKFNENNPCDGDGLKQHGENWFHLRNQMWNKERLFEVPSAFGATFKKYIAEDHEFWDL